MSEFIALFALFIIIVSAMMSVLKKKFRNTKRNIWWLVALLLSFIFSIGLERSNDFGMGYYSIILYTMGIYAIQYFVSQKMLDRLVKKLLRYDEEKTE